MKKSIPNVAKKEKMSPEKLKNVTGGNQKEKGFDKMPALDPKEIKDALRNRLNDRNS